jgi:mRNA interferase RelE/StbE
MADVELSEKANKTLDKLEDEVSNRIIKKLGEVEDWPGHYLESLQGYPHYKLRVGDYRVIVDWERDDDTIYVLKIGHRRNIYK